MEQQTRVPSRCPLLPPALAAGPAPPLPCPEPLSQEGCFSPHPHLSPHSALSREKLPFLDRNQREGPQSWAFRLASPEPDILGLSLGAALEQRSRLGGLPSLTSSRTDLSLLLMFYSGQSQLRHFNRNSTIHAQQKLKSQSEKNRSSDRRAGRGRHGPAVPQGLSLRRHGPAPPPQPPGPRPASPGGTQCRGDGGLSLPRAHIRLGRGGSWLSCGIPEGNLAMAGFHLTGQSLSLPLGDAGRRHGILFQTVGTMAQKKKEKERKPSDQMFPKGALRVM